ncbi:hypothetical protein [uncultured Thiodictyon sp.]|uniref:hypothetical protein n=1 Tax=uncultured Thiodictyon sp. TaxID=1846217 RepID=UPI0025D7B5C8|nr:hypothetical protein [uncultured Thiodictyon sp.]
MISKTTLIYAWIAITLVAQTIILSIIPIEYAGYLTAIAISLLVVSFFIDKNALITKNPGYFILLAFITMHLCLIVMYQFLGDTKSVINLIALTLGYIGIYAFVTASRTYLPTWRMIDFTFFCFLIILAFSIPLSIGLTAINYESAPAYYPWDAFINGERLLLLRGYSGGKEVGHSISMWLAALSIPYIIIRSHFSTVQKSLLVVVMSIFLIKTGTRTGLLLLLSPFSIIISSKVFQESAKYILVGFGFFVLIYYMTATNQDLSLSISNVAQSLQDAVPGVRLYGTDPSEGTTFIGRDTLNEMLFLESLKSPWIGHGDESPILINGVTMDGDVASFDIDAVSNSESELRLACKYGWLYVALLGAVVIYPAFNAVFGKRRDITIPEDAERTFILCIYAIVSVGVIDGLFEHLNGHSALLLFVIFALWPTTSRNAV